MARILVVDDQPAVRQLLHDELADDGHAVIGVASVEEARQRLRALHPDLVVLDLYLEGPEGFHLLETIKRAEPKLPVIILTAYDSFSNDPRISQADAYVIKSLNLSEFRNTVEQLLRNVLWAWASGEEALWAGSKGAVPSTQ